MENLRTPQNTRAPAINGRQFRSLNHSPEVLTEHIYGRE